MKETILTRWNDLSVATKEILRRKEPLKLTGLPQALELLSQISLLTSQDITQKSLIITYHISDAIFIEMLLKVANPDLAVKLRLPHQKGSDNHSDSKVIIAPFSLFLFEDERHETFAINELTNVVLDQRISHAFITEYLMVKETFKTLFDEGNETTLLFTDFQSITNVIQPPVKAVNPLETIKPKGEKISLGKSSEQKKAPEKAKDVTKKPAETNALEEKNAKKKSSIKATVTEAAPAESQGQDPSAFIAVVARNVQRQYIRDYIREHNLQHVLIVTHNRQSARLLEKYLYRARIRSRVVHEKIDEETATSLFDRYNEGQFTAMILMHRVVEDLAAKIQKCDSVIFLDFPTVYSEYANRLEFVQTHFKPQHFISISTENDRAWVQALFEEYPDLNLPLVEVDIKPPKKRHQPAKTEDERTSVTAEQNNDATDSAAKENTSQDKDAKIAAEEQQENNDNPRDRRHSRRAQPRQNRQDQRQERNDRNAQRRDNNPRNNQRRRQEQPTHNTQSSHEFGDSQSDFFSINQDEIVNHNRLPFEAGSFEANIARENRRRGRDAFNTPGGIGQSTNGNFLQNITQGFNTNGNGNGNNNPQSQNRRNNNSNNRNRPRKNNRKK